MYLYIYKYSATGESVHNPLHFSLNHEKVDIFFDLL